MSGITGISEHTTGRKDREDRKYKDKKEAQV
jgi:hypothetical protein